VQPNKMASNPHKDRAPGEDPLRFFSRVAIKLNTSWLRATYAFAKFGKGVSIHYSCDIERAVSGFVSLEDDVYLAPDVWFNVAPSSKGLEPKIILGRGCKIGRRSTISCKNRIILEADILLAPSVLIMDHNHEFNDTERPIHEQGETEGGRIVIERNCWLGQGAVIVSNRGELRLGRNSVVAANAVVTKSFPPFSVVGGNPAKLLKTYDEQTKKWIKPNE
jgi:acetyltransferase-like isoleucine patch superfamily enzyme